MRTCAALLSLIILSSFSALAQSEKLPDVLQPDAASEAEARRMGAKVVKLLRRGRFEAADFNAQRDDENPLGIRGGGAYYSFTNNSHSYNKVPQIGLHEDGRLSVGFYGIEYGFFADLGRQDLSSIDAETEKVKQFLAYRPPLLNDDFIREAKRIRDRMPDRMWAPWVVPLRGNTYLLRAVSSNKPGILVAFQVLPNDNDPGSVMIAWKKIADFDAGLLLYTTDENLQEKVDGILSELEITGMDVRVEKNQLQVRGTYSRDDLARFKEALQKHEVRHRGIGIYSTRPE